MRTREALITAAIELLGEHPADELSVTAIVNQAGVSRQVFYEHFTDRDALLLAAGRHLIEPAYAAFAAGFDPGTTYPQQVTALFAKLGEHEAAVRSLMDSAAQGKINRYAVELMHASVRDELAQHLSAANVDADEEMIDDTARFLAAGTQEVFARGFAEGTSSEEVGRRIEGVRRTLGAYSMGESLS